LLSHIGKIEKIGDKIEAFCFVQSVCVHFFWLFCFFKMSVIISSYITYFRFAVPAKLKLLSVEENDKVKDFGTPHSWYIRWGDLYYFDENGVEKKLSGFECEPDRKRPDSVFEEDD